MSVADFVSLIQAILAVVAEFLLSEPAVYFVMLFILAFCVFIIKQIISCCIH